MEDITMRKIFQYIMLAVVTIVMASCTSDIEETTATTGKSNVQLVVGEFPAFGDSQTRAIGTPDEGKTSWAEGDELLLVIDNTFYGKQYATFTYNGKSWKLTSGELVYLEGDPAYIPHVYYAPNYKWEAGKLVLKEGKDPGTDEYIEGNAIITGNDETITVSFAEATRKYSRLRIATMPNKQITVDTEYFTPAGSSDMEQEGNYTLTSDEKGNAYLYGTFENNSEVTVKYREAALTTHTFSQATESAKSYALDATVVSLTDEGITRDQIVEDVKKELDAGKTYINLILAPDVDEETLEAIHIGLLEGDARDGSINLTLIGCKKIPSRGFLHFDMLKSIVLPDVTEIGENAFSNCSGLQKVVLGNLKKVYGNVGKKGIFDGCRTEDIDLVLPKNQEVMKSEFYENSNQYIWKPTGESYFASPDKDNGIFLGYQFRSVESWE